jgi:hypothetical protein
MKRLRTIIPTDMPRSIVLFALTYLGFAICALINNLILIDGLLRELVVQLGRDIPAFFGVLIFGVRFVFRLLLLWLVVWRVNNVARWFVCVLSLPWVYEAPSAIEHLRLGDGTWLPWLATFVFLAASVACLFVRDTRLWFDRKGHTIANDRSVFD